MRLLLISIYFISVFLSVCFAKLSVGLPVRSIVLIAQVIFLFLLWPRDVIAFLRGHIGLMLFFAAFGAIGLTMSILNGIDLQTGLQFFIETIIQPVLAVIATCVLITLVGVRAVATVFIGLTLLSGLFALVQAAGFEPAWTIREIIAGIQSETARAKYLISIGDKAMGLSLTPMSLAYQLMSALVMGVILVRANIMRLSHFNMLGSLILLISFSTEIRSFILGVLVSLLIANLSHGQRSRMYTLLGILVATIFLPIILSGEIGEARVVNVDDGSAVGRIVLVKYGLNLARDNPLGFGWGFDTRDHFWLYWTELMTFQNPHAVYSHALHNYFLNVYLTYGFTGAVILGISFVSNPGLFMTVLFIFSGYFVNAVFHNAGVLNGDINFWYAYSVFIYLNGEGAFATRAQSVLKQSPTEIYRSYVSGTTPSRSLRIIHD